MQHLVDAVMDALGPDKETIATVICGALGPVVETLRDEVVNSGRVGKKACTDVVGSEKHFIGEQGVDPPGDEQTKIKDEMDPGMDREEKQPLEEILSASSKDVLEKILPHVGADDAPTREQTFTKTASSTSSSGEQAGRRSIEINLKEDGLGESQRKTNTKGVVKSEHASLEAFDAERNDQHGSGKDTSEAVATRANFIAIEDDNSARNNPCICGFQPICRIW